MNFANGMLVLGQKVKYNKRNLSQLSIKCVWAMRNTYFHVFVDLLANTNTY